MRKRFLMVVALMVALTVPLRLSALAAEASEDPPVEVSEGQSSDVSDVFPSELFLSDGAQVNDLSWVSQTYSFDYVDGSVFLLSFLPSDKLIQDEWQPYYAWIRIGSEQYFFPYHFYNDPSGDCRDELFCLKANPHGGYILTFGVSSSGNPFIRDLWSFIALLCLPNSGYSFGGGSGDSPDYTAILNQISDKLNAIQSGSSSDLTEVTQLLSQVVASNASVKQAVNDMHSAMVSVITSTNNAVENLGDELQQRFDDAMSTLDEGLTAQGQALQDMTGRMDSMETSLKDSVGGSFQIDDSASGSVDSVGTEGFQVISSTLDQMLSSFSWISALVGVFLMIVLAKRILT